METHFCLCIHTVDVVVPDVSPFKPKVNVRINSQQQITPSPTLSEALARYVGTSSPVSIQL